MHKSTETACTCTHPLFFLQCLYHLLWRSKLLILFRQDSVNIIEKVQNRLASHTNFVNRGCIEQLLKVVIGNFAQHLPWFIMGLPNSKATKSRLEHLGKWICYRRLLKNRALTRPISESPAPPYPDSPDHSSLSVTAELHLRPQSSFPKLQSPKTRGTNSGAE